MEPPTSEIQAALTRAVLGYENATSEIDKFRSLLLMTGATCKFAAEDFALVGQRNDLQTVMSTAEIIALKNEVVEAFRGIVALEKKIFEVSERTPGRECPICLGDFKDPEATPCGHLFCTECLRKWLEVKDGCPTCRRDVKQDDQRSISEEVAGMEVPEHRQN